MTNKTVLQASLKDAISSFAIAETAAINAIRRGEDVTLLVGRTDQDLKAVNDAITSLNTSAAALEKIEPELNKQLLQRSQKTELLQQHLLIQANQRLETFRKKVDLFNAENAVRSCREKLEGFLFEEIISAFTREVVGQFPTLAVAYSRHTFAQSEVGHFNWEGPEHPSRMIGVVSAAMDKELATTKTPALAANFASPISVEDMKAESTAISAAERATFFELHKMNKLSAEALLEREKPVELTPAMKAEAARVQREEMAMLATFRNEADNRKLAEEDRNRSEKYAKSRQRVTIGEVLSGCDFK